MSGSGDFISREAICLTGFEIVMCNGDYKELCKMILDKIANAPAADVRPVRRGKWGPNVPPRDLRPRCSACGELQPQKTNYCPNCGADMREES